MRVKPRLTFQPYGKQQDVQVSLNRLTKGKGTGLVCSYYDYTHLVMHSEVLVKFDLKAQKMIFKSASLFNKANQ